MKLWGGRFQQATSGAMEDFHSSISFDMRLYREDIAGSIAHARMLGEVGVLTPDEAAALCKGLAGLLDDIENGAVEFTKSAEDIHMNIETLLTERIGPAGKKLHTGRSRNDQVALDMRMYMRKAIDLTSGKLIALLNTLLDLAQRHTDTVMPGYTHLQKAQPVSLAHHLMAYAEMFSRDLDRLQGCFSRTNIMPLGNGALAGSTYPLDRQSVADSLGFASITANSLDGVSDRDFCIEYCFCAALIMTHLSRFCEEIILWSSDEFRFVTLSDAYSTGSSIMPQKKNPDAAELIRGKTGRVYGDLMALLSVMKGLPLAYNKDMQEDKEQTFDAVDTATGCLDIFEKMLSTAVFNKDVMLRGASGGFTNATDAADYLVKRGLPFREAHEVIGRLVLHCISQGKAIGELGLEELQGFCPLFAQDVYEAVSLEACIAGRKLPGGPAPQAVQTHIDAVRARLLTYK